jgi:transmembrane sensor
MTNILDFNDRFRIEDEASLWIARIDRKLTATEEDEFKVWITSDPCHYKIFMSMAEHWDRSEEFHLAYLKSENALHTRKIRSNFYRYSVAASLLLAVVISVVIFKAFAPGAIDDSHVVVYSQSFLTQRKSSEEISLPDGTRIKLNAGSKVKAEYTAKLRKLELASGEVYVEVAHETNRPFIVATGNRFIRAIGTAFNVEILPSENVELIVVDGRVVLGTVDENRDYLNNTTQKTVISHGQQAVLSKGKDTIVTKSKTEIEQALAWQQDALVFDGQTLAQVLVELNRYSAQRIELETQELADIRIAGYFKIDNMDSFFSAVENNFGILHRLDGERRIVLYRKIQD